MPLIGGQRHKGIVEWNTDPTLDGLCFGLFIPPRFEGKSGWLHCDFLGELEVIGNIFEEVDKKARRAMSEKQEQADVRFIEFKGATYLRREDVVAVIETVSATEETDVRWRLEKLYRNLAGIGHEGTARIADPRYREDRSY